MTYNIYASRNKILKEMGFYEILYPFLTKTFSFLSCFSSCLFKKTLNNIITGVYFLIVIKNNCYMLWLVWLSGLVLAC